jgi:hypothetical protein
MVHKTSIFIKKNKIDWRCGSRGKVPTLPVLSSEFKPQSHQKQRKRKKKNKTCSFEEERRKG